MCITTMMTAWAMTALAAAAPLDEVSDPAAGAAFAEVFARLDALETQLGVEHKGREAAEARAEKLSGRVEGLEGQIRGQSRDVAEVWARCETVLATNKNITANARSIESKTRRRTEDGDGSNGNQGTHLKPKLVRIHMRTACSRFQRRHHRCRQPKPQKNGHRRFLQASKKCTAKSVTGRTNAVNKKCCQHPQDCSSGAPSVCTAGCAKLFLPFWIECAHLLSTSPKFIHSMKDTVTKCRAAEDGAHGSVGGGVSLARQLNLVCDGVAEDECVPQCSNQLHGDILLLNIDGDDSKFSCNFAHGKYSWVGAASEGGYLGKDVQAFFSAVSSGAAGNYLVTMIAAAGISTALTIRAGQIVSINGGGSGKGERKFTTAAAAAAAAAPPPPSLLRRHPYNNSNNNIRHTGHT